MVEAYILYLDIILNKKLLCERHFLPRQIETETYLNFAPIYELFCFFVSFEWHKSFLPFVKKTEMFWVY